MKQDKEFHKIKAKLSWPRNQTFLQRTKHSYNNNNQLHHQAYKIFKTPKWTLTYRRWSQIPNCWFVKPLHVVVDENLATTVALSLCYNPQ